MTKKAYRDSFVAAHVTNTVASQIASLRADRKWTQGQLADKSGMRQSRISALEDPNNDNFEVKTLLRLASAFDVGLTVRFVRHSEVAEWSSDITPDKLAVPDFQHDSLPSAQIIPAAVNPQNYGNVVFFPYAPNTAQESNFYDFLLAGADTLALGDAQQALFGMAAGLPTTMTTGGYTLPLQTTGVAPLPTTSITTGPPNTPPSIIGPSAQPQKMTAAYQRWTKSSGGRRRDAVLTQATPDLSQQQFPAGYLN